MKTREAKINNILSQFWRLESFQCMLRFCHLGVPAINGFSVLLSSLSPAPQSSNNHTPLLWSPTVDAAVNLLLVGSK